MVGSNCYQIRNFFWHGENILELHSGDGYKLCEEPKQHGIGLNIL